MNCQKKDCDQEAVCGFAINVPAMGCPIPEHEPLRLVIGMEVCEKHLKEMEPQEFFGPGLQFEKIFRIAAKGKAEPDFKRAFITRVDFDSKEWKILRKR